MRAPDEQLANDHGALIHGLHSLRKYQAESVRVALAAKAPGWTIEGHDDYDGDMMLIITAPEQPSAPAYVLSSTHDGIWLARVSDDAWETLSRVDTLAQAIELLQQTIGVHALGRVPA